MKLSQFKFKLPEEKIALHPTKYRDESRLMVLHKRTGEIEHKMFKRLTDKREFLFHDTADIAAAREEFLPRYYLDDEQIPKIIAVDALPPDDNHLDGV